MSRELIAGRLAAALLLAGLAWPSLVRPAASSAPDPIPRIVSARIVDSIDGEPLADVTVIVGASAVTTDPAGRFTIPALHDTTLVTVRRIGFQTVALRAGAVRAEIALRRAPVVLTSLRVTASAAPHCGTVGDGTQLGLAVASRRTLSERGASALAEAMETTEGVSTSRPGCWGAKAYVRGLGGERVAVLLDGNRVNRACNVGMDGGLATISPDNVERVEVIAGPGSTLYGSGNVGGVINVVTRGPRESPRLQGEVRASASTGVPGGRMGGTLWSRHDRVSLAASVDAASYGDQRSPLGTVRGSSFRDATVDLAGSYGLDRPHRLDARVQRYAGRDIGYPGSGSASIPEEDRLLAAIDYGWQARRGVLDGANAKLYLQSVDHHMLMSMVKGTMRSETDATSSTDTWGGRAQVRLGPVRAIDLDAGIEGTRWNAEGSRWVERQTMNDTTTMEFHSWPGVRVTDVGAFTQAAASVARRVDASAGVRLDHILRRADGHEETTEWVPSGNVGFRVAGPAGVSARVALGFGYRAPDPTELYGLLLRPDGYVYVGEPTLRTETSRNLEFSTGWTGARARISATLFRNDLTDFISAVVTGDSIARAPVRRYANVTDGRIEGLTGSVSVAVLRWLDLRGTAATTRGENRVTGTPLPSIAPFEATAAARVAASGPWPWVEPEVLATARQDRLAPGEVETPGVVVLNLRAGRSLGSGGVTLGLENVLDRSYRRHLDPAMIQRPGRNAFIRLTQHL